MALTLRPSSRATCAVVGPIATTTGGAFVPRAATQLVAADPLAKFISEHPTTKMLALAFILLVGVALVADGLGFHIPRGYLYFAIAFSLGVELLNIQTRRKAEAKVH